jgi:cytochrome d ubiquinol oxidase subunit I
MTFLNSLDALLLARIQFAFTVSFHIVFPSLTIGLASYLAVLEGLHLRTGRRVYLDMYEFWLRPFSLAFGMGVISGLVMAFQFGTAWSGFSRFAGSVTGPLLAYEVMSAFFLEAGFLGVMLFGRSRVGPRLHFVSTVMVAVGTLISTTWILASNSWMQTPQGHAIVDGRVVPLDWMSIIFNPSFPYRLVHMSIGAFLSTALLVGAAAAWQMLRGRKDEFVLRMQRMAIAMILCTAPLQALVGDAHGLNTVKYQPAKIAAMEGHWRAERNGDGVPLLLFGLPDAGQERTHAAIGIPHLGSLILTHSWSGEIDGLSSFPKEDRPNAAIVFWTFRVMVGLGTLMIALGVLGAWLLRQRRSHLSRTFLRISVAMGPSGFVAILAGWMTTEIGRQPWVVYGVMRTAEALGPAPAQHLATTLAMLMVLYLIIFSVGTTQLVRSLARGAPAQVPSIRRPHVDSAPLTNRTA